MKKIVFVSIKEKDNMKIPFTFRLIISKGSSQVLSLLKKYASKLRRSDALHVSKTLLKKIEKINREILLNGVPSHLYVTRIQKQVQIGVFLKPDKKCIRMGDFIGTYTGIYELVESDLKEGTSYAYDLAQELPIAKKDYPYIKNGKKSYPKAEKFAIQTNALEEGNFTRFINHSSLCPNVEAVISKMPDGTMEIQLFALKKIHPGEQLLSNYGGQYWEALRVIPQDMTPSTYTLNRLHKVVKHKLPPALSPTCQAYALKHRSPMILSSIEGTSLWKKIQKALPLLPISLEKQVEDFEEAVIERGIPRQFVLKKRGQKWNVMLNPKSSPIENKEFIGVLSGTLSTKPGKAFLPISNSKDRTLAWLDPQTMGCFTKELLGSPSNVKLQFYYDKNRDSIIGVLLAIKPILPGSLLGLCA